jgi:hypothetical protein
VCGEWDELGEDDCKKNEQLEARLPALEQLPHISRRNEGRVITEADRSVTTILLPEEY